MPRSMARKKLKKELLEQLYVHMEKNITGSLPYMSHTHSHTHTHTHSHTHTLQRGKDLCMEMKL